LRAVSQGPQRPAAARMRNRSPRPLRESRARKGSRNRVRAVRRRFSSASSTRRSMRRSRTERRMRSPSRTSASGPPEAASGVTCRTMVPKAVPFMRISDADYRFTEHFPRIAYRLGKRAAQIQGEIAIPVVGKAMLKPHGFGHLSLSLCRSCARLQPNARLARPQYRALKPIRHEQPAEPLRIGRAHAVVREALTKIKAPARRIEEPSRQPIRTLLKRAPMEMSIHGL
jgi:hypothetical protein